MIYSKVKLNLNPGHTIINLRVEERDRVIINTGKTDHIYNIIIYPLSIAQAGVHPQILGGKKT